LFSLISLSDNFGMKNLFRNQSLSRYLFLALALLSLTNWINSGIGLLMGIFFALFFGNPYLDLSKQFTHRLLAWAVVGLGAGMNLAVVANVGFQGLGYTILGIATALLAGTALGRLLKTSQDTSLLITVGTAICGGSAIAAVAPVIRAKHHEISVALGIVFLLNALALFLFPTLGHYFGMNEEQFGLWSALAIHDTSSVIGATLQYGPHALEVGTTVKLARALWIVPIAFAIGFFRSRKQSASEGSGGAAGKKPWFILGFLIAAALVTWIPDLQSFGHQVEAIAKHLFVLTLFLIGSNLTPAALKSVGVKPFIQGTLLWALIATTSLVCILENWIHL
jgi:uncharacterized integral membrane protein (TIGR00698 family)